MSKIYVACKKINRAVKVMDELRSLGHEITYDWTVDYSEDNQERKAAEELNGIREADVFIYLWESDAESARYEAGMAMALEKKIIVSGGPISFFFNLPNILSVKSDEEILSNI